RHTSVACIPPRLAILPETLLEQGRIDEAAQVLGDAPLPDPLPQQLDMMFVLDVRARVRIAQGRLDEGIADLRELGRRAESWVMHSPGAVPWRAELALALREA